MKMSIRKLQNRLVVVYFLQTGEIYAKRKRELHEKSMIIHYLI